MSAVDVVVPCYNYSGYLEQCVGTLLRQEGVEVRVLIIDDCSSDETPAVGRRLAAADPRVQYLRHEKNRGHIATYNEGLIDWATAEYSLLLSADDALAPGALRRATRLMDGHPEVGMTYGLAMVIVDDEPPPLTLAAPSDRSLLVPGSRFLDYCFSQTANPVPTPSAVVRTELQRRIGGYKKEYPHTGDLEMWMRFASQADVGVIHDVQAFYRWHSSNMSQQYYERPVGDRREFAQACRDVLESHGSRFPGSHRWWNSISRCLGEEAVSSASTAFNEGRMQDFKARLEFAEEMWPGVRSTAAFWRLAAKRLVGQAVWQRLRPAIHRLRGVSGARRPMFSRGMQFGSWPA